MAAYYFHPGEPPPKNERRRRNRGACPVSEIGQRECSTVADPAMISDAVVVLDFGSQFAQLITRRVREIGVYCELRHHGTPWNEVAKLNPKGVILSGGPASVYDEGAPQLPDWLWERDLPVL